MTALVSDAITDRNDKKRPEKGRFETFLAAATVATTLLVSACGGARTSSKIIFIGGDFATSGADASAGVPTQQGAQLAIEQEAARGLPGGYTLEARFLDDTVGGVHDAAQGVRNVESLLQDPQVLALVGPQNSSVARAEIPVANSAAIALVSPSATSIELTDDSAGAGHLRTSNPALHTFFRTVLRDDLQGSADAAYAIGSLHVRRAYVIDDNESYGRGIADVFARTFAADGGTVLERAHFAPGQQDFIALLTRAQGMDPDLVYYGGVVSTGGALLRRQMMKLDMHATMMGGDGLWDPGFIAAAGASADGVYCSNGAPDLAKLPSAAQFLTDYNARFHQSVGTYSANAYVAAEVEAEAIRHLMERNGGVPPTREEIVHEIASSTVQDTPLGPISFDTDGDVTTPVVSIWEVRHGAFAFIMQQRKALR